MARKNRELAIQTATERQELKKNLDAALALVPVESMEWRKKGTKSMHNSFREPEEIQKYNQRNNPRNNPASNPRNNPRNNPLNNRKRAEKRIQKQLKGQLGALVASKEIAEVGLEDLLLEPEVKT